MRIDFKQFLRWSARGVVVGVLIFPTFAQAGDHDHDGDDWASPTSHVTASPWRRAAPSLGSVCNTNQSEACSATVNVTSSTPLPASGGTGDQNQDHGQVLGASLPDTGSQTALAGALGIVAIGGSVAAYRRSRRKLQLALRRHS